MKAIQVRYLGPTDTKPSRLKVMAYGLKPEIYNVWRDAMESDAFIVARKYCKSHGWSTALVGGQLPNGDYVFCFRKQ